MVEVRIVEAFTPGLELVQSLDKRIEPGVTLLGPEAVIVADMLALKPGEPVLIAQATTGSNHAARWEKLEEEGFAALCTGAGARLDILSWCKAGPRGGIGVFSGEIGQ